MVSKNNRIKRMEEVAERQSRFGIRKLTVGAASVLLGTTLWLGNNANVAHADTGSDNNNVDESQDSNKKVATNTQNATKTVIVANKEDANTAEKKNEVSVDAVNKVEKANQEVKAAAKSDATSAAAKTANTKADAQTTQTQNSASASPASQSATAKQNAQTQVKKAEVNTAQKQTEQAATQTAKQLETQKINQAAQKGQTANSQNDKVDLSQAALKGVQTSKLASDITSQLNKANTANKAAGDKADEQIDSKTAQNSAKQTTEFNPTQVSLLDAANENLKKQLNASLINWNDIGKDVIGGLVNGLTNVSKEINDASSANVDTSKFQTVTDYSGLQSAVWNGADGVNVKGTINNYGGLTLTKNFYINGLDGATINLGSSVINNMANLTLANVTVNGSIKGGTVIAKGKVVSNVDYGNSNILTKDELQQQTGTTSQGISTDNWKSANIFANRVIVDPESDLTVNRSITGDGIALTGGSATIGADNGLYGGTTQAANSNGTVAVGYNGKLTINLKDAQTASRYNESETSIDNANAGIRAVNNGHVMTGDSSQLTINAGHGRAIDFNEPFGGNTSIHQKSNLETNWYNNRSTTRNANYATDTNNSVIFGDSSKVNITGRDGILMGNRSLLQTGNHSVIHIDSKGNGAGLLGDAFSTVEVSPQSQLLLTSDGKDSSGQWSGGNFIGLGENGQFRVEHDATFRYKMTNRGGGSNNYDDNMNILSTNSASKPMVYVGPNATFDGQSDYRDYFGEIFAFPLGGGTEGVFQIDGAKYVNWEKNSINNGSGHGNLYYSMGRSLIDATANNGRSYYVFKWSSKNLNDGNITFNDSSEDSIKQSLQNFKNMSEEYWQNVTHLATTYSKGGNTAEFPGHFVDSISMNGDATPGMKHGNPLNKFDGDRYSQGFNPEDSQRLALIATIIPVQKDLSAQARVPYNVIVKVNKELKPGESKVVQQGKEGLKRVTTTHYYNLDPSSGKYTLDTSKGTNGVSTTENEISKEQDEIIEVGPQSATVNYIDEDNGSTIYTSTIESAHPYVDKDDGASDGKTSLVFKAKTDANGQPEWQYLKDSTGEYVDAPIGKTITFVNGKLAYTEATDATNAKVPEGDQAVQLKDENGNPVMVDVVDADGKVIGQTARIVVQTPVYEVQANPVTKKTFDKTVGVKTTVTHHNGFFGWGAHDTTSTSIDIVDATVTDASGNKVDITGSGDTLVDKVINQLTTGNNPYKLDDAKNEFETKKFTFDNINKATGQAITLDDIKKAFAASQADNNVGQSKPAGYTVAADKLFNSTGPTVNVYFTKGAPKDEGSLVVVYHDTTLNVDLQGYGYTSPSEPVGDKITYDPAKTISELEGYGFVPDYPDGKVPANIIPATYTKGQQKVIINLKHTYRPVDPDNPISKDNPIDPKHPNNPINDNVPSGYTKEDLQKTISRTVNYLDNKDKKTVLADPINQSVTFTGKGYIDEVTGNFVNVDDSQKKILDQNGQITWSYEDSNGQRGAGQSYTFANTAQKETITKDGKTYSYTETSPAEYDNGNGSVGAWKVNADQKDTKQTVNVYYDPNLKDGTITVIFHDNTENKDIPGYGSPKTTEKEGTPFNYSPDGDLTKLENLGYVPDGDIPTIPTEYTPGDQTIVIPVKHGTRPVTPTNPLDPKDPVDPEHPNNPNNKKNYDYTTENLQRDVTRNFKYVFTGNSSHPDIKEDSQVAHFEGSGTVDKVTGNLVNLNADGSIKDQNGQITWTPDNQTLAAVAAKPVQGYHITSVTKANNDGSVDKLSVTKDSPDVDVVVVYSPDEKPQPTDETASLRIVDNNDPNSPKVLSSFNDSGKPNTQITFAGSSATLSALISQGYVFQSAKNDQTNSSIGSDINSIKYPVFDNDSKSNQSFTIYLTHNLVPVTPNDPHGQDPKTLTDTTTATVKYVVLDENRKVDTTVQAPATKTETITWTRQETMDQVTGEIIPNGKLDKDWTPSKDSYTNVTTPVLDWHTADKRVADFSSDKPTRGQNPVITVTYVPNGHVIPVDKNGKEIPGLPAEDRPQFPTDPHDPTKTTNSKKPNVPGYHPETGNPGDPVNPDSDPTVDVDVPYVKGDQIATVIYRDVDDNYKQLATSGEIKGEAETKIPYSTADELQTLENEGYVLANNEFDPEGQTSYFDSDDKNNQVFYVDLKHGLRPVTPDNPGEPDKPINPNDPNPRAPKYPKGTAKDDIDKVITRTIHYTGAGSKTPADVKQQVEFTASGVLDRVTGKWTTPLTWNKTKDTLPEQKTPIFNNYHVVSVDKDSKDGINVDPANITKDDHDYQVNVVYAPNGKIVPVDKDGNEIPGAKQPTYPTNPEDPKNVQPNEDTPNVPGYHIDPDQKTPGVDPKNHSVTPVDPNKDTPVVYIKDDAEEVTIGISYFDDTKGQGHQDLSKYNTTITKKPGEALDYTTQNTIKSLEDIGYELVSDSFTSANLNGKMPDKNANYEVHLIHKTTPVTPNNPGKPKQPINPNDPDGPKYPDGTTTENIDKTVTRIVHYVINSGDAKAPADVKQQVNFTATGTLDNVTGKWILSDTEQTSDINKGLTWSKDQSVSEVPTPAVDGYHVISISRDRDGKTDNVKGVTLNHNDTNYQVVVTYVPNDTDLINKQNKPSTQTVRYVDENGDKLASDKVQKSEFVYSGDTLDGTTHTILKIGSWNETSHTYTTEEVPVIDGYVAYSGFTRNASGQVVAGGLTASVDNPNVVATVVYKKVGSIVPVEPDGKTPLPDPTDPSKTVPKVPYKNDPNDPTKVTPNEPVPNVPGYTPSTPTVTPNDPTVDTNVPYTKPDDNTQHAEVIYQDIAGSTPVQLATSGDLTGKPGDKVDYSTATEIKTLTDKGYVLVQDGFQNAIFDNDGATTQKYYVTFKHGTTPVTPDNPGKPGQPINPDDPEGPKYPTDYSPQDLTKHITRTIHYVGAGNDTPKDVPQDTTFIQKGVLDKVTGNWITPLTWDKSSETVKGQTTPRIDGYHVVSVDRDSKDNVNVDPATIKNDASSYKVTVTYAKNGHIVPVDPNGNPIPKAPTPQYPTDPTDPSKVTPNEPVPNVPGYHPVDPTPVTPKDPGKDTPVVYEPDDNIQHAVVIYQDVNGATPVQLATSGDLTGNAGTEIKYSTTDEIKTLTDKGYVLVKDGFVTGTKFDDDKSKNQTFYVTFKHGTTPVNPDNPGKPGEPINPNDPNGPKYPDSSDTVTHDVTRTINYVDNNGKKIGEPITQTAHFTGSGVLDKVTGQWVTPLTWSGDGNLTGAKSPVIDGYHITRVSRDSKDNINVDSATVKYNTDNYSVDVVYTPNGHIVPVDPEGNKIPNVPTPEYPTDPNDPTKVVPDEPVPNIPGYTPSTPSVTPNDPGKDTPVIYTPVDNTQHAVVIYQDVNGSTPVQLATSGDLTGNAGTEIKYSTADEIKTLTDKGYVLVKDGFVTGTKFDDDKSKNQTFYVTFKHGTTPVNPDNPGKPGEPINPNDPDGPKYPDGSDIVTHDVTRTINYVDNNGNKIPGHDSVVQTAHFTGSGVLDKVTGQWITPLTWSGDGNLTGAKTPVIDGYHVTHVSRDSKDNVNVDSATVKYNTDNYSVNVIYTPNGHIVPVDPEGNKIPNVPTPEYPTDPTDPSKVTPNEPVPNIPGKTPSTPTVTPQDPGNDTPVIYTPVDNTQHAVVIYQDVNGATPVQLATSGDLTGDSGTEIKYSTADEIKTLTDKGYVLVKDGFVTGTKFDDDKSKNQTFYVTFKHGTTPVNPDNPGKPGEPINPNDPNGPKYPDGSDTVTHDVTRTINYVDNNGKKIGEPITQTAHFTGNGVLDKVTGQWVTPLTWSGDGNLIGAKTPVIDGYHVTHVSRDSKDNINVDGTTVKYNTDNYSVDVVYTPNGHIVPVDPEGNKIPNVPTPEYPTDPNDPSKVVPNEPVPSIPGMTPQTPTVTPKDPGKDTPVVYNNDQGSVVVIVHDQTTDTNLDQYGYNSKTVDEGTKVDYDWNTTKKTLEDHGYVIVTPNVTIPSEVGKTAQTITIEVKHGTTPVNPDNPGKPGQPINPNDPDGPKWPTDSGDVTKDVTRTITFVDKNGKEVAKSITQTVHFTANGVIDKVTGKYVTPLTWSKDQSVDKVNVPVVDGYHTISIDKDADGKTSVKSVTLTHNNDDYTVKVTYEENGHIVPVDPSGNPIPNAPTPQYPTDPTNPSEVTPNEPVPSIPGMTPETSTVTPKDPGKDTKVIYNTPDTPTPVTPTVTTVVGKQTITFVDGDNGNTPLRDADVQTHTFTITDGVPNENSYTFGTINVPVIDGYVAEVKTAGGKTVTPDNPDANVTVVYHKIGKIVPVDKDHNPIPGVETPQYKNDPNDPTKVVPDEPVPTIDGYTPNQNTVTPQDPTKDTEVVYTKNEEPEEPDEPDTPEPSTPKKHHNNKPKPSKPKTPKKTNWSTNHAPHAQNWNNNIAPHAQNVNGWSNNIGPHGETVDANGNILDAQGNVIGYVDKNGNPHYTKTLPQTGEKDNSAAALGMAAASLGLIGLAGVKKRRKKN